jgi:hypothetical protein
MKRILLSVASIVLFLATHVIAQQSDALKLEAYGWQPPDRLDHSGPLIAIDHKGRIVVGFTGRQRAGLVTRDAPSLDFHILRFTPDGKIDLSLALPTKAEGLTGIYLSNTDEIIARANESLQLLQANDSSAEGHAWKRLAECKQQCFIEESVTRRTLHLYTPGSDPPSTLIRVSHDPSKEPCGKTEKLIESTDDQIQNYPQTITDAFAYFALDGEAYRWPLCRYEDRVELSMRIDARWIALSDALFLLNTSTTRKGHTDWKIKVIASDGRVKFQPTLADGEWALDRPPIRSSERGDRVAVDIITTRGGIPTLDIGSHATARRIAVYDIEAGREVASVPISVNYKYQFEFDLSPDGHRLAILRDGTIRLIDLQAQERAAR